MVMEYADELSVSLALRAADQRTQGQFAIVAMEWTSSYDVPFLPMLRRSHAAKLLIESDGTAWDVTLKPRRLNVAVPVCSPIRQYRHRIESLTISVTTVFGEWTAKVLPGVQSYSSTDEVEEDEPGTQTWTASYSLDDGTPEAVGDY